MDRLRNAEAASAMRASASFHGYEIRETAKDDLPLASNWNESASQSTGCPFDPEFWIRIEPGRENFLVRLNGDPVAFFQVERIAGGEQARLHIQECPDGSPKVILRGLAKLVPLIEKALSLRGVRAIFFTSHSSAMSDYMKDRLGFSYAGEAGRDGVIMLKKVQREPMLRPS